MRMPTTRATTLQWSIVGYTSFKYLFARGALKGATQEDNMLRKIVRFRKVTLISRNLSGLSDAAATTDEDEIKKFSKRAAQMWNINGPDKPLHFMNHLRVPLIRNVLLNHPIESQSLCNTPSPLKNYHILDVGCGVGILSEPLARLGADVTGIDPVEENITIANEHCSRDPSLFASGGSLNYKCCTVEDVTNGSQQFDLVVASEVLEHISQLNHFLFHLCTTIKPGGFAVFTTINRTFMSYVTAILLAEYLVRLMPVGTHDWKKFIVPSELERLLTNNGLTVIFHRDNFYNPLTGGWSWCSHSGVGYAMVATKPPRIEDKQQEEDSTPT